jgi:ryanodine receptor 2
MWLFIFDDLEYYCSITRFCISDVMARMEASMPTLEAVLTEVDQFTESEKTYADAPHVIDVILPLLCSYLPFWWSQGPDNVSPTGG